ncbi:tyrosine-type recombinase/integrase [Halomonas huangheensis]|uniref:tyrosine-type recombinase/integrase n=1 Tax=Halomonas huangheensis TaxID=1178482 RepID=UPI00214E73DA|nr:tyrosine-type recombinase/integrase [Halomonas huangheensis]
MLHHIRTSSVQRTVKQAMKAATLPRPGSCHTLRHSFAMQLLSQGTDNRKARELLSHKRVKTPQLYTHVLRSELAGIRRVGRGLRHATASHPAGFDYPAAVPGVS